jgi:hypothetical protein
MNRINLYRNPPTDEEAVLIANRMIAQRTAYGVRREIASKGPFSVIAWSNSRAKWDIAHPSSWLSEKVKKARVAGVGVELDANEVLIPVAHKTMKGLLTRLKPLPLYALSTEGKKEGLYPEARAPFVRRALESIVKTTYPELDPEEVRIKAMSVFDTLAAFRESRTESTELDIIRVLSDLNIPPAFSTLLTQWLQSEDAP